jgi:hypothetical protein
MEANLAFELLSEIRQRKSHEAQRKQITQSLRCVLGSGPVELVILGQ